MDTDYWYQSGDISPLLKIDPKRIVCFDTETTGLDPYKSNRPDEILQLAIVRGDGEVLFSSLIKPSHKTSWKAAEEVHGISPAMVRKEKTIDEYADQIRGIFAEADLIVGYNLEFDMGFLMTALGMDLFENVKEEFDVMHEYAPVAGAWNSYHEDWKWQKLSHCARHYGFKFDAHDALEDTKATLHCFFAMLKDDKPHHSKDKMTPYLRVVEIYKESHERVGREIAETEARIEAAYSTPQPQMPEQPIQPTDQPIPAPTVDVELEKQPGCLKSMWQGWNTWQKIGAIITLLVVLSWLF